MSGRSTAGGIVAIALWSTVIAVTRSLTEDLGTAVYGALCFLGAGTVGSLPYVFRPQSRHALASLPRRYLLVCGLCFVAYQAAFFTAVGCAVGRPQAVAVGIVNYLWPSLTLAFSIPILKRRAHPSIWVGIALAIAGMVLAVGQDLWGAVATGRAVWTNRPWVFLLALAAAVLWALYSNLSRRWAGATSGHAVPLFLLASGLLMLLASALVPRLVRWSTGTALELAYATLFPALLAYALWDRGVRSGNLGLLSVLAFFIPLVSTAASGLYLRAWPGWNLWVACALVVAGALVAYRALGSDADETPARGANGKRPAGSGGGSATTPTVRLPAYDMGRPRVDLADRDALERAMEGP